ncbi:MAG: hypothetical protein [Wendovervirus sonii]|uniref:Uncharacterized protein n=1 Tax=phage Lak_Megaphage_Sonny TaxID=3109229 RepID=A0ABZ0Z360_9CAUD|nr:MAG: hypothetical protein [phage Lak_Megaphage_Sonny]
MKISENFKVLVNHPLFGDINVPATLDMNTMLLAIHPARIMEWEKKPDVQIDLHFLVNHDIDGFNALNESNNESHQINMDSLKIHYIEISGTTVRIHYVFDQFKDDKCWRMCAGHTSSLHVQTTISPVSYNGYSSDCAVYW